MAAKSKKPEIRFAGFEDEWEQRKLNEITDVRDGTHASPKYFEQGHPFVTSKNVGGGFINYKDIQYISDEDFEEINKRSKVDIRDILMGMIGTIGNIALIRTEPDFAIKNVALIKDTKQVDYLYIYHYLQSTNVEKQFASSMDGGTQKFIALGKIRNLDILLPSKQEQADLGIFMLELDNLITLQQKKVEKLKNIKSACMEKMFPQGDSDTPEIRFSGFTGAWRKCKLADIANRVVRKNANNESSLPLTISAIYGLVDQFTYFDNRVASVNVSNYYLVMKGEFAYNKSSSSGFPFGVTKRLDCYEKGVLSTLYIVFSIKNHAETNSDFLVSYFDTDRWHKGVAEVASEGARNHGLLNIAADDFLNINLYIPEKECEQALIGTFFKNLDSQITLQQQKVQKLKNIKSACMEKMFV